MKKVLFIVLTLAIILTLLPLTALAETSYNGSVAGIITDDGVGNISGYVDGAYDLTFAGNFTGESGQYATFTATVDGDIEGVIEGLVCVNGLDTMFAQFTSIGGSVTSIPVYIKGCFLQSGIKGDFEGEIVTGPLPPVVNSIVINTEDDAVSVAVGSTLQCSAVTDPAGFDIEWAVWAPASGGGRATIDQNGLLTALETGTVVVIANTLDPELATKTKTIEVVNPQTEVTGEIDPTFMIVIPSAVDFGTLVKDGSVVSKDFDVTAQGVLIEAGAVISVTANEPFKMKDLDGAGSIELPFTLSNATTAIPAEGGVFTTFTSNRTENGSVSVNTDDIEAAGSYKGTMVFTISYN